MNKTKYFLILIIFLIIPLCTSCATTVEITDEYIANIETAKESAVKIATISEFKTCFIRACLGSYIDKLPYEIVRTLDDIDLLLKTIGADYSLITDCQRGQMLGLWTRLVTLGTLEIIEDINPGSLAGLL